jgi:hypothetical protein
MQTDPELSTTLILIINVSTLFLLVESCRGLMYERPPKETL